MNGTPGLLRAIAAIGSVAAIACSSRSLEYLASGANAGADDGGAAGATGVAGNGGTAGVGGVNPVPACSSNADCLGRSCRDGICIAPTCSDGLQDRAETGIDCGGVCPGCAVGVTCLVPADCLTGTCIDGVCQPPDCSTVPEQAACIGFVAGQTYQLRPSHAKNLCADVAGVSASNDARLHQWICYHGSNQQFWAVEREDGWFALQSALSGKCVEIADASLASGTKVQQRACTFDDNQLWRTDVRGSGVFSLSVKHSGHALDVEGAGSPEKGGFLIQSVYDGSADMQWQLERSTHGYMLFEATTIAGAVLRHRDGAALVEQTLEIDDSRWFKVVPGLADANCVSFEAKNLSGRFLRHRSFRVGLEPIDGSSAELDKRDATFCIKAALNANAALRSFEAFNFPGSFIHNDAGIVRITANDGSSDFANNASWRYDNH